MELSVLIQPTPGSGFRASTGEPFPVTAVGTTRDEALRNLRAAIEDAFRAGAEVVRLHVAVPAPTAAVWPDDAITADWLAGIAAARQAADAAPDPWDDPAARS